MPCTLVEDILVDPVTPEGFWSVSGTRQREAYQAWIGKSFIQTTVNPYFPTGIRYDVYCLEDASASHPTVWGMFGTIEEAVQRAKEGPPWQIPSHVG